MVQYSLWVIVGPEPLYHHLTSCSTLLSSIFLKLSSYIPGQNSAAFLFYSQFRLILDLQLPYESLKRHNIFQLCLLRALTIGYTSSFHAHEYKKTFQ